MALGVRQVVSALPCWHLVWVSGQRRNLGPSDSPSKAEKRKGRRKWEKRKEKRQKKKTGLSDFELP